MIRSVANVQLLGRERGRIWRSCTSKSSSALESKIVFDLFTKGNANCILHTPELQAAAQNLFKVGMIEYRGKSQKNCRLSGSGLLCAPIDAKKYYEHFPDPLLRPAHVSFNTEAIDEIAGLSHVFTFEELAHFNHLDAIFQKNKATYTPKMLQREYQRVTLDYIWKSASLEGNTYSILDTDLLLSQGLPNAGKHISDATMILDHKETVNFISTPESARALARPLTFNFVSCVHSKLTRNLPIQQGVRDVPVGISFNRYQPPPCKDTIMSALHPVLRAINNQKDPYSEALVATVLLSYLQAFEDGNKRTARMVGYAMLLQAGKFPLTYRLVDTLSYIHALSLFYERNNLSAFKDVFITQAEFATQNYYQKF